MKYGLMTYAENKRTFNIGDYIQSLAAKQFLPQVDCFINREKLARYTDSEAKLIMNGWFTHNTTSWVPSAHINPLLISFHVNNSAAPNMLSPQGIAFLKSKQPIGCRDHFTVNLLQEKGIEAYFSGCLTLTLDSYQACDAERGEDIYIVDPLYGFPNKQRIFYDVKSLLRSTRSGDVFHMHIKQQYLKNIYQRAIKQSASHSSRATSKDVFRGTKIHHGRDVIAQICPRKIGHHLTYPLCVALSGLGYAGDLSQWL